MATNEELIQKLYNGNTPASLQIAQNAAASNLEAQKAGLEADYNKAISDLDQQKADSQKATAAGLNKTAVESEKQQRNFAETANAYGLTSGAMAQARLAQGNAEVQAMATQRAKQQETEAQIERQRGILSDQYAAALREAQASNDYNLAQQLYAAAKEQEGKLEAAKAAASYAPAKTTQDVNDLFTDTSATPDVNPITGKQDKTGLAKAIASEVANGYSTQQIVANYKKYGASESDIRAAINQANALSDILR